jgi:hypothetical protein
MTSTRTTPKLKLLLVTGAAAAAAVAAGLAGTAAEAKAAANVIPVTVEAGGITSPARFHRGRETVVVRNALTAPLTFLVARGGMSSLRYTGARSIPYVPAENVLRRTPSIRGGGTARLALALKPGRYLFVSTAPGSTLVARAVPFVVS